MCLHIHKTGLTLVWNTMYLSSDSRVILVSWLMFFASISMFAIQVGTWRQSLRTLWDDGDGRKSFLRTVSCLHIHKTGWTCQGALRPLRNLATTGRFSSLLSFDCYFSRFLSLVIAFIRHFCLWLLWSLAYFSYLPLSLSFPSSCFCLLRFYLSLFAVSRFYCLSLYCLLHCRLLPCRLASLLSIVNLVSYCSCLSLVCLCS